MKNLNKTLAIALILTSSLAISPTNLLATTQNKSCQQIPQSIRDNFDIEGTNPYSKDNCSLIFEPLKTKVATSGGNGYRHEFKIKNDNRVGMNKVTEALKGDFTVEMSNGGKTIITQYHNGEDQEPNTFMKVYVSDTAKDFSGRKIDGKFEVFVRITPKGKSEKTVLLGTIKSGDTFTLEVKNTKGTVKVTAFDTSVTETVANGKKTYLKFGNYLQSQNPATGKDCKEPSFDACYQSFGITTSKVTVKNITYSRQIHK